VGQSDSLCQLRDPQRCVGRLPAVDERHDQKRHMLPDWPIENRLFDGRRRQSNSAMHMPGWDVHSQESTGNTEISVLLYPIAGHHFPRSKVMPNEPMKPSEITVRKYGVSQVEGRKTRQRGHAYPKPPAPSDVALCDRSDRRPGQRPGPRGCVHEEATLEQPVQVDQNRHRCRCQQPSPATAAWTYSVDELGPDVASGSTSSGAT